MFQKDQELIVLIIAGTIMLLLLGFFIVSFLFFYQKKHNAHIIDQETLQSNFRQELLKTQIEVQEQTLTDISREIHDNISQVLSFVKLNLALTGDLAEPEKQEKVNESRELVAQAINDLRNLSRSISFEHIATIGLVKTIEFETERINKSGLVNIIFRVEGVEISLGEQAELVLFRIFQEALNNTLKYANAKYLKINLQYSDMLFTLTLEDDGVGFSANGLTENSGAGLKNIQNRAALIGADAEISSSPGKGCCITVKLNPKTQQLYADGTHPDSIS